MHHPWDEKKQHTLSEEECELFDKYEDEDEDGEEDEEDGEGEEDTYAECNEYGNGPCLETYDAEAFGEDEEEDFDTEEPRRCSLDLNDLDS